MMVLEQQRLSRQKLMVVVEMMAVTAVTTCRHLLLGILQVVQLSAEHFWSSCVSSRPKSSAGWSSSTQKQRKQPLHPSVRVR
jgi:hypothetical protein